MHSIDKEIMIELEGNKIKCPSEVLLDTYFNQLRLACSEIKILAVQYKFLKLNMTNIFTNLLELLHHQALSYLKKDINFTKKYFLVNSITFSNYLKQVPFFFNDEEYRKNIIKYHEMIRRQDECLLEQQKLKNFILSSAQENSNLHQALLNEINSILEGKTNYTNEQLLQFENLGKSRKILTSHITEMEELNQHFSSILNNLTGDINDLSVELKLMFEATKQNSYYEYNDFVYIPREYFSILYPDFSLHQNETIKNYIICFERLLRRVKNDRETLAILINKIYAIELKKFDVSDLFFLSSLNTTPFTVCRLEFITAPIVDRKVNIIYKSKNIAGDLFIVGNTNFIKELKICEISCQSLIEIIAENSKGFEDKYIRNMIVLPKVDELCRDYGYLEYLGVTNHSMPNIYDFLHTFFENHSLSDDIITYLNKVYSAQWPPSLNIGDISQLCGLWCAISYIVGITDLHAGNIVFDEIKTLFFDHEILFDSLRWCLNKLSILSKFEGIACSTSMHVKKMEIITMNGIYQIPFFMRNYKSNTTQGIAVSFIDTPRFIESFAKVIKILVSHKEIIKSWLEGDFFRDMRIRILPTEGKVFQLERDSFITTCFPRYESMLMKLHAILYRIPLNKVLCDVNSDRREIVAELEKLVILFDEGLLDTYYSGMLPLYTKPLNSKNISNDNGNLVANVDSFFSILEQDLNFYIPFSSGEKRLEVGKCSIKSSDIDSCHSETFMERVNKRLSALTDKEADINKINTDLCKEVEMISSNNLSDIDWPFKSETKVLMLYHAFNIDNIKLLFSGCYDAVFSNVFQLNQEYFRIHYFSFIELDRKIEEKIYSLLGDYSEYTRTYSSLFLIEIKTNIEETIKNILNGLFHTIILSALNFFDVFSFFYYKTKKIEIYENIYLAESYLIATLNNPTKEIDTADLSVKDIKASAHVSSPILQQLLNNAKIDKLESKNKPIILSEIQTISLYLIFDGRIKSLVLQQVGLTAIHLGILIASLVHNQSLSMFDIGYNYQIGDAGVKKLCHFLMINHSLMKLNVSGIGMTDDGFENLSKVLSYNKNLITISFNYNTVTRNGLILQQEINRALSENSLLLHKISYISCCVNYLSRILFYKKTTICSVLPGPLQTYILYLSQIEQVLTLEQVKLIYLCSLETLYKSTNKNEFLCRTKCNKNMFFYQPSESSDSAKQLFDSFDKILVACN